MDTKSLFMYGLLASGALLVDADLRQAAQAQRNYVVRQRNAVQFVTKKAMYIEPDVFGYQGLKNQRDGGNYDQFVRSNIDNEQDKRNFHTEAGQDHLPVRTLNAAMDSSSAGVKNKIPSTGAGGADGAFTVTPGIPFVVPLRWNNPHSAELEVNVWIKGMTVVVPVKKPSCAGEGRQDAAFAFTIPTDFNKLPEKVSGFTGCNKVGDCILQIYAHSVEPRQYAIGTPLIVTSGTAYPISPATTTDNGIEAARADPGKDLSKQPNDICISTTSAASDITTAVPRAARLISDVANHAYQNSDYSPYSGQQPESISKNLQASVIISMIPANGGELGKSARTGAQNNAAAKLAAKVKKVVEAYEGIVNKIIAQVGDKNPNSAQIPAGALGTQPTATTFRAAEVGSVTTKRLKTTTYIPALQVTGATDIAAAKAIVAGTKYSNLVTDTGLVQLYVAVLDSFKAEFNKVQALGLDYKGPVMKTTTATMADAKQFKKLTADNKRDQGQYATSQFIAAQKAAAAQAAFTVVETGLQTALSADEFDIAGAPTGAEAVVETLNMHDMNAYADPRCNDDEGGLTEEQEATICVPNQPFFVLAADGSGTLELASDQPKSTSTGTSSTVASTFMAGVLATCAALFMA